MIVDIFGIDSDIWKCYACDTIKNIFDEFNIKYNFHSIIVGISDENLPIKDESSIQLMNEKCKRNIMKPPINYPVVFIDESYIMNNQIKNLLIELGYDHD